MTDVEPEKEPVTVDDGVGIVPRDYRHDPETEDLLYANELEDGMVVLTENGRATEALSHYPHHQSTLLVKNRWAEVSKIYHTDDVIYFIAVYSDGRKATRNCSPNDGWYVKKYSIPEEPDRPTYMTLSGKPFGIAFGRAKKEV